MLDMIKWAVGLVIFFICLQLIFNHEAIIDSVFDKGLKHYVEMIWEGK